MEPIGEETENGVGENDPHRQNKGKGRRAEYRNTADHQMVAAVLRPLTLPLSLKITSAPRKPTPETT